MILAVLFDAFKTQKTQKTFHPSDNPASISVRQDRMCSVTGLSDRSVIRALNELNDDGRFIRKSAERTRQEDGKIGVNAYAFMHPHRGVPLLALGKNLLLSNKVTYLTFPKALLSAKGKRWSMKNWSTSKASVYFACASFSNAARSASFEVRTGALVRASGLTLTTFKKAFPALAEIGLLDFHGDATRLKGRLQVDMFDPYTGELPVSVEADDEDQPSNYRVNGERLDLNCGTADELESLLRSAGYDGPLTRTGNDLLICCPFHNEKTPSCSVSWSKACFFCFGCDERGSRWQLIKTLLDNIDPTQDRGHDAITFAAPPDVKPEAVYSYRDRHGRLVKQVLRYPGKVFRQRMLVDDLWVWSVAGAKPVLYNEDLLDPSKFVIVCEGEKDCEALTRLHAQTLDCRLVAAVTSGAASSWKPEFAERLKGKKVVVATDDDAPGDRYGDLIQADLSKLGIVHRRVRFSGTGCKDVDEALSHYEPSEVLLRLLGSDWAREVVLERDRLIPDLTERHRPHSITALDQEDERIRV